MYVPLARWRWRLRLIRIFATMAGLLFLLLLAACQAPTELPAVTEVQPARTAVPSPTATPEAQAPVRATPTSAPTLLEIPQPTAETLPGQGAAGGALPVHFLPAPACCLAADPFDLRAVYALLADGHFYVSPDRGQTWRPLPLPHPEAVALEAPTTSVGQPSIYVSANRPGLIFVHSRGSLLRSTDRGQTWQEVARDTAAWTVNEGFDSLHLYAWRSGAAPDDHGLFRSQDGGETWQVMYNGDFPPATYVGNVDRAHEGMLSIAADPGWEEFIYAGTNYGIFRSMNGGRTWEPFDSGLPPAPDGLRRAPQLLVSAAFPSLIYALTEAPAGGGSSELLLARLAHGQIIPDQDYWEIAASGDLGGRINQAERGFYGVFGLERDPLDGQALYLATADGLLASLDGGQEWRLLSAPPAHRPVYRVEAAPGVPAWLYLSTAEGFASLPFEWPGPGQAASGPPWPRFSESARFQLHNRIGGDLTAYAVDQTVGADSGLAYVAIGSSLVLMDVSQESVPDLWSSVDLEGELAKAIAVSPGRVYLLSGERTLREIDVSDRAGPRQVAKIGLPNPASILALHELAQMLLVSEQVCSPAGCQGGLRLFDVRSGLREVVFLPTPAPVERIEFAGDYAYAFELACREWACTAGVRVVDLAAEPLPRVTAYLELPGQVVGVEGAGDHLYVAHRRGLTALDISDPARPRETNPLDLEALASQEVTGMALAQDYAYLYGWSSVDIFSLEDPDHPRLEKTWQPSPGAGLAYLLANQLALYAIDTSGEFGYCSSSLRVFDLSDPLEPRPVAREGGSLDYVCADRPVLVGDHLYLDDWDGLHILDLADPLRPRPWSDYTVSGSVNDLVADQLRLFWSNSRASKSLYGMDVSRPESFSLAGPLPSTWSAGMAMNWNFLYVPAWADGLKVLDVFDYWSPVLLKTLSSEDLGGSPLKAFLDGRYLYLALGGDPSRMRIVDVADPSRPRVLGRLDLPDVSIQDLAIRGNEAYLLTSSLDEIASQGQVVVVDIRDPATPRRVANLNLLEGEQMASLAAGSGFLYLGGQACPPDAPDFRPCSGRLIAYSLADPRRPERAGQLDLPSGVRDIALDGDFAGERGYLATGPAGVWALDLSDPARPAIAGQQDIPSGAQALAVVFNRIYVAAGEGGLVVLDVTWE